MTIAAQYQLVPPKDEHKDFLFLLYSQTFGKPFHNTGLPDNVVRTLIGQQYALKEASYQNEFPGARHSIIEFEGKPAGQIRLNSSEKEIHIIDISVLPAHQRKGLATSVIQDVLNSKKGMDVPVCLNVESGSTAQALYEKLGFVVVAKSEVYDYMVRSISIAHK